MGSCKFRVDITLLLFYHSIPSLPRSPCQLLLVSLSPVAWSTRGWLLARLPSPRPELCRPLLPTMILTLLPSSSEQELPPWVGWVWCWHRLSLWLSDHWLCQEPQPQAAAFLLCHSRVCPVRGHGPVLPHDGLPAAVRILSGDSSRQLHSCSGCSFIK